MEISLITFLGIGISTFYYCNLQHEYIKKKTNYPLKLTQCINLLGHDIYLSTISSLYLLNYISDKWWLYGTGISTGYIFYDIYLQMKIKNKHTIIFHHLVMIFSYITPFLVRYNILSKSNGNYNFFLAHSSLCEISAIFLEIVYLLHKLNKQNTIIFKINYLLLLITYIPTRLINFPYVLYLLYLNNNFNYSMIQISCLTVLSYYWYYKLFMQFVNAIKQKKN